LAHYLSPRGLARSCDIYVARDHAHTQHGHLELLYVVVYKTDKGGIAGTNNSHLLFAHKPFEFSHDYFNILLICGEPIISPASSISTSASSAC
jgi:hypothetical protein